MVNIPVISFAAWSGTGKTTLVEKLIPLLKEKQLRIAVIKHDGHDFEIDYDGKDSRRFYEAGADITVVSSSAKTAIIEKSDLSLEEIISRIRNVDLIIVEGYKNSRLPQIGLARKETGKGFTAELSRFAAVVTDMEIAEDIPKFGFNDTKAIADFIMERMLVGNVKDFTHFNDDGRAKMVDVGEKPETKRSAIAQAKVLVNSETFQLIKSGGIKKGDVLTVAQIAGIMGAKKTSDIIPMCHPIMINGIDLSLSLNEDDLSVEIKAEVSCDGRTGVEMEALTAASTAALTVYDMCKAVQKDIVITDICLVKKTGGVHGDYIRRSEI